MRVETSEGFIVSSSLFFFFFLTPSKAAHSLLEGTSTAGERVPEQGRDVGSPGGNKEAPPGFSTAPPSGFAIQTHPGRFSMAREKSLSTDLPS